MKTWQIKELGDLTGVSRRTLHHYDRIGLLKPSIRQENNYRLYSERDLGRLQQILALKFFGFELKQIAALLNEDDSQSVHNLRIQHQLLHSEISRLQDALQCLSSLIEEADRSKSINWQMTVKLIEVFKMNEQLNQTWLSNIFTQDELKQYAELKVNFTEQQKQDLHQEWLDIIAVAEVNLNHDPASEIGAKLSERTMTWVVQAFKNKRALGTKIWHGYVEGKHDNDISQPAIDWLRKALDAYYTKKCDDFIAKAIKVDANSKQGKALLQEWQDLVVEKFGDDLANIDKFYQDLDAEFITWLKVAEA